MKDRFAHVRWFVFHIGYARCCEFVAERLVVSSEVDILGESRAMFNVWVNGAV